MDYGVLIDNHLELIRFDDYYDIYISRKALKHFVESRKKEMCGTHTQDEIINKLYFAIDNVVETYVNYDEFKVNELQRLIYIKYFNELMNHSLRIVADSVLDRIEICSIHFQKRKIPP
jgi:hypothetical protein